jgi:GT2 family glycosyltransferase
MLSAIIVNHRSSDIVDACLRSLHAGTVAPGEAIVIDNEGTGRPLPPDLAGRDGLRVERYDDNPGYSVSCNRGVRLVGGDELLFLNADVTLSPDCLEHCLTALCADSGIGALTPRLVRPDGSLDHACHRGLPTPLASAAHKLRLNRLAPRSHRLARYTMTWLDPLTDHDVEACSGAFMLMPRAAFEEVGGWDERYRFYADDLDLCARLGAAGKRVRYVGTATAIHKKGAHSYQRVPDRELTLEQRATKRRLRRHIAAAHRLFYEEHLAPDSNALVNGTMRMLFRFQDARLNLAERRVGS